MPKLELCRAVFDYLRENGGFYEGDEMREPCLSIGPEMPDWLKDMLDRDVITVPIWNPELKKWIAEPSASWRAAHHA